jgi:hypothetical protein
MGAGLLKEEGCKNDIWVGIQDQIAGYAGEPGKSSF